MDFEGLEGFDGGADFLDFLVVITDGTDSNFLLVESDDTSWGWGLVRRCEVVHIKKIESWSWSIQCAVAENSV